MNRSVRQFLAFLLTLLLLAPPAMLAGEELSLIHISEPTRPY